METIVTTHEESNRQIIGRIYQKVNREIYAIFRQVCIPEDICEDLVQDVFMKILGLDIILEDQLKGLAVQIAYQKRTDYLRHLAFVHKVQNDCYWRIEQTCTNSDAEINDIMKVEVELDEIPTDVYPELQKMTKDIQRALKDEILLTPQVFLVKKGTLPVSEGKAVRVKDLRPSRQ